jgi:hypothetical protein
MRDNPDTIWALDEPDGISQVFADGFKGAEANGEYNSGKFFKARIPITYSGTVCVNNTGPWSTNNYATDNNLFYVPSQGMFSASSQKQNLSFEFWMNLELPENFDRLDESIIFGESAIVKLQGENTNYGNSNTGVYIKNFEYLVFKIGDYGKAVYESEVHVENFNAPLHVVCLYSPTSIQIVVNGKAGRKVVIEKDLFLTKPSAESERKFNFKFPAPLTSTAPPFLAVSFDTVAVYNYQLTTDLCKIHYVYGLGYSINKTLSANYGGTSYDLTMQSTAPVKAIDYYSSSTWTPSTVYNRLEFINDNLVTASQPPTSIYLSSTSGITKSNMFGTESGTDFVQFPDNSYSYVEVSNYEKITDSRTSGVSFKFSIPSTGHGSNEQQLFYIGSKSSNSSISATITGTLINITQSVNGNEPVQMLGGQTGSFSLQGNTFVISMYVLSDGKIKFGIKDSSTGIVQTNPGPISIFPLQDAYIRVGTAPVFIGENIPSNISIAQTKRFDGKLFQIDIHNQDLTGITSISQYPQKTKTLLYQAYPIKSEERFAVAVNGTFEFGFFLSDLVETQFIEESVNNIKLPVAVDIGSDISDVKYTLEKVVDGVTTQVISSANAVDLRYLHVPHFSSSPPKVKELYFNVKGTLKSIDNEKYPGILNYLRIYSYNAKTDESVKYLEINTDSRGSNPRIYTTVSSSVQAPFKKIADVKAKTDLYRSFNTGIQVGSIGSGVYEKSNYVSLPLTTTPTNGNLTYFSVMFAGRAKSGVTDINLLKYGNTEIKWSTRESGVLHPTNGTAKLYINGDPYESGKTYNINVWNHYAIVFNEENAIPNTNPLIFGFGGSAWQLDNLLITSGRPSANAVKRIYSNAFSVYVERRGYGSSSLVAMYVNDSDLKSSKNTFQPLSNQASFSSLFINVASNKSYPISITSGGAFINYGGIEDLLKVDNVKLSTGMNVLFKDQGVNSSLNGIYQVTQIASPFIFLAKLTNPSNFEVVYVSGGKENKNYYFIRSNLNNYTKEIVQKKVVSYKSNVPVAIQINI